MKKDEAAAAARSGRPRDPALDDAIITATEQLLGTHGYAGVSMEAIAAQAGVTKPTIYRRWPTKAVLVADALVSRRRALSPTRVPGDLRNNLRDDLLGMVIDDHRMLRKDSGVILGVVFAARSDQDLSEAIRRRIEPDVRTRLEPVLERAVARGEMDRGAVDSWFLLRIISSMLCGAIFRDLPDETEFLTRFVDDLLMPALTARRTAPATSP